MPLLSADVQEFAVRKKVTFKDKGKSGSLGLVDLLLMRAWTRYCILDCTRQGNLAGSNPHRGNRIGDIQPVAACLFHVHMRSTKTSSTAR